MDYVWSARSLQEFPKNTKHIFLYLQFRKIYPAGRQQVPNFSICCGEIDVPGKFCCHCHAPLAAQAGLALAPFAPASGSTRDLRSLRAVVKCPD